MSIDLVGLLYLVAAGAFIAGLKMLASPKTAPRGNLVGAAGMALAVLVTMVTWTQEIPTVELFGGLHQGGGEIVHHETNNLAWILVAMVLGAGAGAFLARTVQMTGMPQLVAVFNGLGGLASAVVALGEVAHADPGKVVFGVVTALGILIGGITFTGSVVAWAKLEGKMTSAPITFGAQKPVNALLLLAALAFVILFAANLGAGIWLVLTLVVALALGVLAVIPIGGADMPVVIALLNSYSGIAAAAAGYAIQNPVLLVAGALVGASGIILTVIMCRAMNRSLANVLFGAFGVGDEGAARTGAAETRTVRNFTPEDGAILLGNARRVVVVPGYGMAVAQAQHGVRELGDLLQARGVAVEYAIHPVAGRMPGHMNVLLAEANVPYDHLIEMEQANPMFEDTDVVLVIGANDVVNPAARHDKDSPIYGMPILDVDKARNVIILKRSLGAGFAGIQNELFFDEKTMMLFGDAKQTVNALVAEVKAL